MKHLVSCFLIVLLCGSAHSQVLPATETASSRHSIADRFIHFYVEAGVAAPLDLGRFEGPAYSSAQLGLTLRAATAFRISRWLTIGPDLLYSTYGMNLSSDRYEAGRTRVLIGGITARSAINMLMPATRANTVGEQKTAYVFSATIGYATIESDEFLDFGYQSFPELSSKGQWSFGLGFGIERDFTDWVSLTLGIRWLFVLDEELHLVPFTVGAKF